MRGSVVRNVVFFCQIQYDKKESNNLEIKLHEGCLYKDKGKCYAQDEKNGVNNSFGHNFNIAYSMFKG